MPRKRSFLASSAFRQVQRQASALLGKLGNEIRAKEAEVRRLKEEWSQLGTLTGRKAAGRPRAVGRPRAAASTGKRSSGRINWRSVLKQVPKQFKASDIRRVRGLSGKRPSEIFAAITRWIDAGLAKRKTRGLYEKH